MNIPSKKIINHQSLSTFLPKISNQSFNSETVKDHVIVNNKDVGIPNKKDGDIPKKIDIDIHQNKDMNIPSKNNNQPSIPVKVP